MSSYDNFASSFSKTRYSHWNNVKLFLDKIPKYSILYDVGCGNFKYKSYRNDIIIIGNDISFGLLECALDKYKDNPQILLANGLNLPYKNKSSDFSISIAVLHHLDTYEKRLQYMKELIRITIKSIHISVWAAEQQIKSSWIYKENNDYLIPWQNKYMRFYHLFHNNEILKLLSDLNVSNYCLFYEKNNWCITIDL